MRKLITTILTLSILATGTAFASPTVDFEKGAVIFEAGTAVHSKVSGKGHLAVSADGKSGYKYAVTAGLGNNLALQFKQGHFKSEDSTVTLPGLGSLTTYAESNLIDINLLYKINPHLTLITGYEHDKISYGNYVTPASKSSLHIGLTATHSLGKNTDLFATLIAGKDVSLREIGISQKLSSVSTLNVSYADRRFNNVDLAIPIGPGFYDKMDYKTTGITCLLDFKM